MKCLALDFGGSSVKYAVVNDQAHLEYFDKLPAPLESVDEFVQTVGSLFDRFKEEIEGITISMPGHISPTDGILFDSGAYENLYGSCIFDLLKRRCPLPMALENDGKCAALAEAWKGALAGCRDGAVIVLGSGIAGGIIKNGEIHSGHDFVAGEFSYLITDPTQKTPLGCAYMSAAMHGLCYRTCKAKNIDLSVQDAASIMKWLDSLIQMPYADPEGSLKKIKADGIQIFQWLKEGDPEVERIYRNFIRSLAIVVHSVQICCAPEKIAIGGGLSLEDRIFTDLKEELLSYYKGLAMNEEFYAQVVKCRYLKECNLVGAMYNYLLRCSGNDI